MDGGPSSSSSGSKNNRPLEGPRWLSEPPREAVFSNSTGLRLDCSAVGDDGVDIEWLQQDQVITRDLHGLRMVMKNGTLVFPPFR